MYNNFTIYIVHIPEENASEWSFLRAEFLQGIYIGQISGIEKEAFYLLEYFPRDKEVCEACSIKGHWQFEFLTPIKTC